MSVLKTAQAGDTIQLAAGVYSGAVLTNLNFSTPVVITSANQTAPAVFSGLNIGNSSGLTFNRVELTTAGVSDPYFAFRISGSQNIAFKASDIHGTPGLLPNDQINGFYIANSSKIEISSSRVHDLDNGVMLKNDSNVTFAYNTVTRMDKGGIQLVGTSDARIFSNKFSDFVLGAGTHSDAIQITTAGSTAPVKNISITDNYVFRNTGDAFQGVFIQDETGVLSFENVTIKHNAIVGGIYNAIYLNGTVKGTLDISDNLTTSWAGIDKGGGGSGSALTATTFATVNFTSGISLKGDMTAAAIHMTGNTAQFYTTNGDPAVPVGNTQVGALSPTLFYQDVWVPVIAPAASGAVTEFKTVTGNILTGASGGTKIYLADVGAGISGQQQVTGSGITLLGKYGTLTVTSTGAYKYVETKEGLVAGQTYVDHFTTTVANTSAQATPSTFDITVTGSAVGNGAKNLLIANDAGSTLSGFGGKSELQSGDGADVFVFNNVAQSGTVIKYMDAADKIDLTGLGHHTFVTNFTGQADEVMLRNLSGGTYMIYADENGDKIADVSINIQLSASNLTSGNFIL